MTTKPDVKIQRTEAKKQAAALRTQAETLRQIVGKLRTYRMEHVQERWSDAVSTRYFKQMGMNTKVLEEQASYLEEIAGGIEQAAETLS